VGDRADRDVDLRQDVRRHLNVFESAAADPGVQAQLQPLAHVSRGAQRAVAEHRPSGIPAVVHSRVAMQQFICWRDPVVGVVPADLEGRCVAAVVGRIDRPQGGFELEKGLCNGLLAKRRRDDPGKSSVASH